MVAHPGTPECKSKPEAMGKVVECLITVGPVVATPTAADISVPSKTARQGRAMAAAAGGNSTLGIPQNVGKEFMQADILRKKSRNKNYTFDKSNQQVESHNTGKGKYGNYTDPAGGHHTHWREGKGYSTGGTTGGGSIGGGSAGGGS